MNAMREARQLQAPRLREHIRARPLLGTVVEIAATGAAEHVQQAISQAFDAVAEIHALMSYQEVLCAACELSEASKGLFDVTIAPTLTRLGFLPRNTHFPRASRHGNWRHIALLPGQRVQFLRQVRIDLSGIAKGYAVDLAIHALQSAGMQAGRVNAGGDLRVFGSSAQPIHVRAPHAPTQMIPLTQIREGSAATSAAYFSQRRRGQHIVTPMIHPHTGNTSRSDRSITVLAPNCIHADALTKVVQADPALATAVLAHYQARAYIMTQDPISGDCQIFDSQRSAQACAA